MGFGVWGLGFGVWGLGFRVEGLGFRARASDSREICMGFSGLKALGFGSGVGGFGL